MTEPKKLQVFLCYSSADREKVLALYEYLQQQGMNPWMDIKNLSPGQDWQLEIAKAISTSDAIIVCLSKNSVSKAGYAQKEIVFALDKAQEQPEASIFIIPAKLEKCEVPQRLSRYHWVDLQQANGYQQLLNGLELRAKELARASVEMATIDEVFWPRKIVARMNAITDQWSVFRSWGLLNWAWVWLYTFFLITPSLHWPFDNEPQVISAILLYVMGSLSVPLLIGLFTNTKDMKFWQDRPAAATLTLRLYTHQGAGIGFHLAYFAIFLINIIIYHAGYYLGLSANITLQRLLEAIEITSLLIVGYGCARLVPDNLWRAYERLTLADGGIFFVFLGLGPLWGAIFYFYYSFLLDPLVGLVMLLSAFTLMAGAMVWRQKQTGNTIIPAHWYILFFGSIFALYLLSVSRENLLSAVALEGLILMLGCLMAFGRIQHTFRGLIGFTVIASLLSMLLSYNLWFGRILGAVLLLMWWRWWRKYLSLPFSFWGVIVALASCLLMLQQQWITDSWAAIIFGVITLFLLGWEWRLYQSAKEKNI